MNKHLYLKLIIFFVIIISQMLPLPKMVSKAQAKQCCDMNCGKNLMSCPIQKKVQSCNNNSVQCCKDNCLNSSKSKILIHKGSFSLKLSQASLNQILFSYLLISIEQQSSFFPQSLDSPKKKVQNHPLFLINSVYLI